jgi:hypothetical protein
MERLKVNGALPRRQKTPATCAVRPTAFSAGALRQRSSPALFIF